MNILYNNSEQRFRAGIRIVVFLVISILFIRPSSLISISWVASLSISLGCLLAAFLVVKGMDKRPISSIGLEVSKVWWIEFGLGVFIAFLAQTIIFSIDRGYTYIQCCYCGYKTGQDGFYEWSYSGCFVRTIQQNI